MINKLEQKIVAAWYKPRSWILLLLPLSWLFRIIIHFRRSSLMSQQYQCPRPLIVVGNIAIGGTGKTPLVIHLAHYLTKKGYKVGIVSRGYGRKSAAKSMLVTEHSDVALVGDEPAMIVQQTHCHLAIGADRSLAVELLLTHFPEIQIIISDDGLQHYKMGRDIEIAVVNGIKRFGNGHCLPAGPLREPVSRLNEVDYIVASHQALGDEYLLKYKAKSFIAVDSPNHSIPVANHSFTKVHAVAGIGEPEAFFVSLEKMGISVIRHVFPDHYAYKESDFAFHDDLPIIMTQKDAIKCRDFTTTDTWYLVIETKLPKQFERSLLKRVKGLLHGKKII